MLHHGIDSLVVVGGDGSLTGADLFRREWPGLLDDLVATGTVDAAVAARHPRLTVVGLVGSIDNDAAGTDMTIGADTALHRITEAIDAIGSTASSHRAHVHRRGDGPPLRLPRPDGRDRHRRRRPVHPGMPARVGQLGDGPGRHAEGRPRRRAPRLHRRASPKARPTDRASPITARARAAGARLLARRGEVRVTVLGHVQRGGSPSAFDRNLGTMMGYAAIDTLLSGAADAQSLVMGMRGNRVVRHPAGGVRRRLPPHQRGARGARLRRCPRAAWHELQ